MICYDLIESAGYVETDFTNNILCVTYKYFWIIECKYSKIVLYLNWFDFYESRHTLFE